MLTLYSECTPEYISDQKDVQKSIILPSKDWKCLMEELEDIKAYDKAKKYDNIGIPFEQAIQEIRADAIL